MRPKHLIAILILLALAVPASPAHAGGVVSVCDEAHLLAALAGGGAVTFTCSGTITLTATITIAADTSIDGSRQTITISGNDAVRAFIVNSGVSLNLNELTVANGYTGGGGGGIANGGTLTVSNSTFSDNNAYWGGGISNYDGMVTVSNSTFSGSSVDFGGGIYNYYGTVTVSNSTFSDNYARIRGGGIYNNSRTVTVSNSTLSGNIAGNGLGGLGGGIYNSGTMSVSNSTFSGNGVYYYQGGGGIYNDGTLTLENTIVANSPTGNNCYGTITDGGGNLSYPDATCPGTNGDPKLGPLQNNLGPTRTMALGPGSAAIDAGIDAICATAPVNGLDQRGIARPWGPHCDIGAVEQVPIKKLWLPAARSQ